MVRCRRPSRNSRPKRLNGADAKPATGADFGLGVVADDEDVLGLELAGMKNMLENLLFAAMAGLVNGIHFDGGEERGDAERADFAFLEPTEAGGDQEEPAGELLQHLQIAVAVHRSGHFQMGQYIPPGGAHGRREAVFFGDEIERQAPHVGEGLRENALEVRALAGAGDRRKSGGEELLARLVGGAETAIKIENDGFSHVLCPKNSAPTAI